MKPAFFILAFAALLSGCRKHENSEGIPMAGDYFPLTASSNWRYVPDNSNTGLVLYGEVLGIPRTVNGKTYSMLNYQPGSTRFANFADSALFRKEGGKYYQAITNQQLYFPLDEPGVYEFVFMEDNAPVGTRWSNKVTGTFTFNNGKLRMEQDYQGQITEFLPSFRLDDNHTYSDVVRITMNMTAKGYETNDQLVIQTSNVYDKWYARNKGLIKTVEDFTSGLAVKLDTLALH
jgi:hypothetical protein